MNLFKKKILPHVFFRIFVMLICLALWNILLVSCDEGDGDGDDEGVFLRTSHESNVIEPSNIEWINDSQVKLQWKPDASASSYLVYDKTEDGPMIRASLDASPQPHTFIELTVDNVDPNTPHSFKILVE